jgi:NhaP-type Na+/H+ or K+/H+ antiporter
MYSGRIFLLPTKYYGKQDEKCLVTVVSMAICSSVYIDGIVCIIFLEKAKITSIMV